MMLTCLWIAMDDLLNSKKELGFYVKVELWSLGCAPPSSSSGCFGKLWLPRSVAQQVVRGWNMLESLNNRTLHFVCQLLEYASSSAMYCVHVPVQLLGWNVAQLASMKKRSLRYVKPKIHVESHILHHGCKQVKIKILYSRVHFIKILNAQSEIELTIKLSQDPEYQVLQVAGCEMM